MQRRHDLRDVVLKLYLKFLLVDEEIKFSSSYEKQSNGYNDIKYCYALCDVTP